MTLSKRKHWTFSTCTLIKEHNYRKWENTQVSVQSCPTHGTRYLANLTHKYSLRVLSDVRRGNEELILMANVKLVPSPSASLELAVIVKSLILIKLLYGVYTSECTR